MPTENTYFRVELTYQNPELEPDTHLSTLEKYARRRFRLIKYYLESRQILGEVKLFNKDGALLDSFSSCAAF
jgi:hypothetical protein